MTDLRDWEDGEGPATHDEPPLVLLTEYSTKIPAPGKKSKTAGYTGIDPERGRVYLSVRRRRKHRYRKENAYAISTRILRRLASENVECIIVYEADDNASHVWPFHKFDEGEHVPPSETPTRDRQKYATIGDATEHWTDELTAPIQDRRRHTSSIHL